MVVVGLTHLPPITSLDPLTRFRLHELLRREARGRVAVRDALWW
jgi:hypothetical protein